MDHFNSENLNNILSLLNHRIKREGGFPVELVVCGGAALLYTGLIHRTTKDVDVLAVKIPDIGMVDPVPLPVYLVAAANTVGRTLNLPDDWLNTGPADIFRMGLPEGFERRLISHSFGTHLTVHFSGRIDQINFKLYASVDRGGYHIDDLLQLKPTGDEILEASRWSRTHDVSDGYAELLRLLLSDLGFGHVTDRI
jgi:hypothetical protein